MFGGPDRTEQKARQKILREQADSKIRELKALTAKRPESGKKILRAAT